MSKALISSTSQTEKLLFRHGPDGYPLAHPADPETGIPYFSRVGQEVVPERLFSFDDLGRARGHESTSGAMFYKEDKKFIPHVLQPLKYLANFVPYRCVITPDLTMGSGMARWERVNNIRLARQAGIVWQHHGLNVVVNVRWCDAQDYDLVCTGIPQGSVIALSNYGLLGDPQLRDEFNLGVPEIIDRTMPKAILMHGKLDPWVNRQIAQKTEVVSYPPNSWKSNSKYGSESQLTFDFAS